MKVQELTELMEDKEVLEEMKEQLKRLDLNFKSQSEIKREKRNEMMDSSDSDN